MTLPEDATEAIEALIAHCPSDLQTYVETIRAHLLSQDAEIERLRCNADDYIEAIGDLVSRLAAADALLRECDDFMENLSIDMRKFGELLSLREKVQAHLQGAGDE